MNKFTKKVQTVYLVALNNPGTYVEKSNVSAKQILWCFQQMEKQHTVDPKIKIIMPEFVQLQNVSSSKSELQVENVKNKLKDQLSKHFELICVAVKFDNKWVFVEINTIIKSITFVYVCNSSKITDQLEKGLSKFVKSQFKQDQYQFFSYTCDQSIDKGKLTSKGDFVYILGLYRRIFDQSRSALKNNMFTKTETNSQESEFDMLCELVLWKTLINMHWNQKLEQEDNKQVSGVNFDLEPSDRVSDSENYYLNEKEAFEEMTIPTCITESKVTLKPHQIRCVQRIAQTKSFLTVHSTGSGKTLIGAAASKCFLDANPNQKVYVISPKSVVQNFISELHKYGLKQDYIAEHFRFMTHELFAADFYKVTRKSDEVHEQISAKRKRYFKNNMMIVDEVHNFRNLKSQSCIALVNCATHASKILMMTATFAVNSLADMIPIWCVMTNKTHLRAFNKKSIKKFCMLFMENNSKVMNAFRCNVSFYDSRLTSDFPQTLEDDVVSIPMTDDYQKKYEEIEKRKIQERNIKKQYIKDYDDDENPKFVFYMNFYLGLRQTINSTLGIRETYSAKIEWTKTYLKNTGNEKAVIFTHFIEAGVIYLETMLNESDISYGIIHGKTNNREEVKNDFNDNKFRVLIITTAGNEGLNLKGARHLIVLDPGWNWTEFLQTKGRVSRYWSHQHLPENQRNVKIKLLVLDKKEHYNKTHESLQNTNSHTYLNHSDHILDKSIDINMTRTDVTRYLDKDYMNNYDKKLSKSHDNTSIDNFMYKMMAYKKFAIDNAHKVFSKSALENPDNFCWHKNGEIWTKSDSQTAVPYVAKSSENKYLATPQKYKQHAKIKKPGQKEKLLESIPESEPNQEQEQSDSETEWQPQTKRRRTNTLIDNTNDTIDNDEKMTDVKNEQNNQIETNAGLINSRATRSRSKRVFGLRNRKYQCYANSILQIFLRITKIKHTLKSLEKELRNKNETGSVKYKIVQMLLNLSESICVRTSDINDLENILLNNDVVQGLQKDIQFDSYEYFLKLIDYVDPDQNGTQGQLKNLLVFEEVLPTHVVQVNYQLDLSMPEKDSQMPATVTISQLFKDIYQNMKFEKFSDILTVIINKHQDSKGNYLQTQKLDISNIEPFKDSSNDIIKDFSLFAVNCHRGNAKSGHYWSYILLNNVWTCLNDENVTTENISLKNIENVRYLVYLKKTKLKKSFDSKPLRWINTLDIDLFLKNIENTHNTVKQQKVAHVMKHATNSNDDFYEAKNVKSFQQNYEKYSMLVSMLNINNVHWIAIIYDSANKNVLEYMDPFGNEIHYMFAEKIINPLIEWFRKDKNLKIEPQTSKFVYQRDDYNCGVICAWYIKQRVEGLTTAQIEDLALHHKGKDRKIYFDQQRVPLFYNLNEDEF